MSDPTPATEAETPYDWDDFEPGTPLQAIAYALMVSGVAYEQQSNSELVRLNYPAAERVLDDLRHSGYTVIEAEAET